MNDLVQDRPSRRKRRSSSAETKNVTGVTQKVAILLVLLTAGLLMIVGARMSLAGIASYQAQAFLDDWASKTTEPETRAWAIAHSAAQRAVDLYPVANGEYFDRLGLVHSWQQFSQPYGSPAAQSSRLAAAAAYQASVEARPVWPNTWARLANTQLQLATFDAPFDQALNQAFQLAPWRIEVQRELARIGFAAWPQLDENQRQHTLESARRTVAYSTREAQQLYAFAAQSGKADVLCNSLDEALKTTRKLCQ